GFGGRSECPRMVAWSFAAVPNASACRRGHSQPFRMPAAGMIRTTLSLLQKSLLDVPSALHEKQHGIVNEQQYEYQTAECQCCIDGAEQVGGEAAEHRADHSAEPLHGADDTPRLGAAAFPYGAGEIFIPGWQHKAVGQTDETGDGEDQPDGFEC